MHEMSLAEALVDEVVVSAKSNGLLRVDVVELEVGELRQVVPEIMHDAFQVCVEDTMANGATLRIVDVPGKVRCRDCQKEFRPEIDDLRCPICGKADIEVLAGEEFILKTIEGKKRSA